MSSVSDSNKKYTFIKFTTSGDRDRTLLSSSKKTSIQAKEGPFRKIDTKNQ